MRLDFQHRTRDAVVSNKPFHGYQHGLDQLARPQIVRFYGKGNWTLRG